MRELIQKIQEWAVARNLDKADPKYQTVKLMEEIGELASGLLKNHSAVVKDSIGDSLVVLIILSMQVGLDIEDCLMSAYEEIKDRRGATHNGIFVKGKDMLDFTSIVEECYVTSSEFNDRIKFISNFIPVFEYMGSLNRNLSTGEMGIILSDNPVIVIIRE